MQLGTINNLNYVQQGEVERNRSNIKSSFFSVRQSMQKPCRSEQFCNGEDSWVGQSVQKGYVVVFVSGVLVPVSQHSGN